MTKPQTIVLVALTTFFLYAECSAGEANPPLLENRAAYYGGFGLSYDLGKACPSGTYSCQSQEVAGTEIGGPCCPDATFCVLDDLVCCPTASDCSAQVVQGPTCADPTWNLLARSDSDLYSCCLSDEFSNIGGECVFPNQSGISAVDTTFITYTQANNAAPSGSNTDTVGGDNDVQPSNTGTGAAPTMGAGSTPTPGGGSTPAGAAATASATKKSAANKNFLAGSSAVLACLLVVVSVLF